MKRAIAPPARSWKSGEVSAFVIGRTRDWTVSKQRYSRSSCGQLDQWNQLRRKHAALMASALCTFSRYTTRSTAGGEHVFHLFVGSDVTAQPRCATTFRANGIGTGIHYPVPCTDGGLPQLGYPGKGSLPTAEQLSEEVLSLPMYAELTDDQIEYTIVAILNFAG